MTKFVMPEPTAWLYEAEFSSGSYSGSYFDWRITQNHSSTRGARAVKSLYTADALKDVLEQAAKICEETHERMNSSFQGAADEIRKIKEQING